MKRRIAAIAESGWEDGELIRQTMDTIKPSIIILDSKTDSDKFVKTIVERMGIKTVSLPDEKRRYNDRNNIKSTNIIPMNPDAVVLFYSKPCKDERIKSIIQKATEQAIPIVWIEGASNVQENEYTEMSSA